MTSNTFYIQEEYNTRHLPLLSMKLFRSIVAITSVFALCISVIPPAYASGVTGDSYRSSSPRGFKRSISRSRDLLNTECMHIEDANAKRACIKKYRKTIREKATPVRQNYVEHDTKQHGQRCGFLSTVQERRTCMRDARVNIPQGNQRELNRNTRSRAARNRRDECRGKETTTERLQCLRGSSSTQRTMVTKPKHRNRLRENTPVNFISPQGLRRNLSRSRDLSKEKCGDILDGNDKRTCIKNVRSEHQGY